jgi:hypothetical protein
MQLGWSKGPGPTGTSNSHTLALEPWGEHRGEECWACWPGGRGGWGGRRGEVHQLAFVRRMFI